MAVVTIGDSGIFDIYIYIYISYGEKVDNYLLNVCNNDPRAATRPLISSECHSTSEKNWLAQQNWWNQ